MRAHLGNIASHFHIFTQESFTFKFFFIIWGKSFLFPCLLFTILLIQVEIEKNKRNTRLRELIEHCSKNIILPEDVSTLLGAHRDRRKDFSLAFANFKNLLDNSKLSVSQMEKLHRQYNSILKDFQQNRQFLDTELPKIINLYVTIQIFDG